jgi:hypothetical protein
MLAANTQGIRADKAASKCRLSVLEYSHLTRTVRLRILHLLTCRLPEWASRARQIRIGRPLGFSFARDIEAWGVRERKPSGNHTAFASWPLMGTEFAMGAPSCIDVG